MKNASRTFVLVGLILLAGCQVQVTPLQNRDNGNTNSNSRLEQPRNQNKNGSDTEALAQPACSESNPPRLVEEKGGNALNYCGKETVFPAYLFANEKIILFSETVWADDYQEKSVLKIVSTQPPFTETKLGEDIFLTSPEPTYLQEKNLYIWKTFADGPGYLSTVFIFRPSDLAFVSFSAESKGFCAPTHVQVQGSRAPKSFFAEKRASIVFDDSNDCKLTDKDVEIIVNDTSFTKKQVDQGLAQNESGIFRCDPAFAAYDPSLSEPELLQQFTTHFPEQFPCFDRESRKISGYFDLAKNQFVAE